MKQKLKFIVLVFIISFFLNLVWENLHSLLYENYQGGAITQFILLRATLSDAIYITVVAFIFILFKSKKIGMFVVVFALLLVSIFIEKWALETSRWAYSELMPLLPFLNTGLTPTIQLALTGYLSLKISEKFTI